MNILIAGGTGFIGRAMVKRYLEKGEKIAVVGRNRDKIKEIFAEAVEAITWEQLAREGAAKIKAQDLIINLTGATIGEKRWTEKRRQEILTSRIDSTKTLAELCAQLGDASPPLFNASAVGVYDLQQAKQEGLPEPFDEQTHIDFQAAPNFLAKVGRAWELATESAKKAKVRVVNLRFGVVMGEGGALAQLKLPFLLFMGGPIAGGQQPFPWVAITDLLEAVDFIYHHTAIHGAVNIVAPNCITQKQFAKALGKVLNRPSWVPTPGVALKLFLGEMAEELVLKGQHVTPTVLLGHGFAFQHPTIESALQQYL